MTALVAAFVTTSVAWACGDKLSAVAGGVRFERIHQARTPGNVLLYAPRDSRLHAANADLHIAEALARAGHRVKVVEQRDELAAAMYSQHADLVLTDLRADGRIDFEPGSAREETMVLPVAYDAREKNEGSRAAKPCVARITRNSSRQLVRTVEELLDRRSRGLPLGCVQAAETPVI